MPNKITGKTMTEKPGFEQPFKMMKVSEFAKRFNISKDHVYRMLKDESLPKVVINEKQYRVLVRQNLCGDVSEENDKFVTVAEASNITGLSKRVIRDAVRTKAIGGIQFNQTTRVSNNSIMSFMDRIKGALIKKNGKYGTVELKSI